MKSSILISVTQDETRVGLLEGGQVVELYVERKQDVSIVGNIYMGKVVKILPGMQSAFVDIGLDKSAFLYVGDIRTDLTDDVSELFDDVEAGEEGEEAIPRRRRHQEAHIEDLIQEGQELLVQVSKDPLGTKGARVTSYVTIPGRYLVFMPNVEHVGISRRIESEAERERLKALVEQMKPQGSGLIIRTASAAASEQDLKQDLEFLVRAWENIKNRKDNVRAPHMLYSDLDLRFRSVRDLMSQEVESLIVDSHEDYLEIQDMVNTYLPKLFDRIDFYDGHEPMFEHYGVEIDITRALDRKVWMKSGGYIVIDQTEAMTVIDVNTGKFVGKHDLEETILKTNLEAVKEIAYQIRLRNVGGIIIIDFIDMEVLANRDRVFNSFTQAMSRDRARNTIFEVSELGLIQMTRKRVRESLGRILCEPCSYCEGKGFVKSAKTVCYDILRKVQNMAAQGGKRIIVNAHPKVADMLSDEESYMMEGIEQQYGIKVIISPDQGLHLENYDLSQL